MKKYAIVMRPGWILLLLCLACSAPAKEKKVAVTSPELYEEIAMQDSLMFAAYNTQNLDKLKTYFSTDLEWFQDNSGLLNYNTVFATFGDVFKREWKLTRQLVKGSLEVHPVKDYGAIETGSHQFRHVENGKEEVGTFKFLMIWKKVSDNKWQVTKVVSYDH